MRGARGNVVGVKQVANHRQPVRARIQQRRGVFCRDAANGNQRQVRKTRVRGAQNVYRRTTCGGFARGREKRAKRQIIRASGGGLLRQLAGVVAGRAQNAVCAQRGAGGGQIAVFLPQMQTVRIQRQRHLQRVIDDKGHVRGAANRLYGARLRPLFVFGQTFVAVLQKRGRVRAMEQGAAARQQQNRIGSVGRDCVQTTGRQKARIHGQQRQTGRDKYGNITDYFLFRLSERTAIMADMDLSALKVMVIDDSNTIRRSAEIFLSAAGCEVILAENGFDALGKIAEHQPDLIFVDIMMPHLDGYQTCALVKKNPRFADAPVIMLSSRDGLFDRARGRLAGSDEYLTKPFTREGLLAVVAQHAARLRVAS